MELSEKVLGQKINDTEKLSYAQIVAKPYLQPHVQGVHSSQIHPAQPHYNVQDWGKT